MKKGSRLLQWIGLAIMAAGLIVLASPFIEGAFGEEKQARSVEQFEAERDSYQSDVSTSAREEDTAEGTESGTEEEADAADGKVTGYTGKTDAEKAADPFYRACAAYNQEIYENHQSKLVGLSDTEVFPIDARNYGFSENVAGTIWIPRMDIKLSLYLGSSTENMALGGAIFGQTSVPLGEENENCAIAGHRGWIGTPMFRDIQTMQIGDPVYVTTPWDKLEYRVCEIRIVPNNDNEWFLIQEGRTLLTLMTCHPYTQNYQRYIVFCELVEKDVEVDEEQVKKEMEETADTSPRQVLQINEDGSQEYVDVDSTTITPNGSEYGAVWSNLIIIAEDKMKLILYILTGVVTVLALSLIVGTIRDRKRSKKHE